MIVEFPGHSDLLFKPNGYYADFLVISRLIYDRISLTFCKWLSRFKLPKAFQFVNQLNVHFTMLQIIIFK